MNKEKIPTSDSYQDYLIESLAQNPQLAADYIAATLEEEKPDRDLLKNALLQVSEALGKTQKMTPQQIQLHAEKLQKLLSEQGSKVIYDFAEWLDLLGLKLTVVVREGEQDTEAIGDPELINAIEESRNSQQEEGRIFLEDIDIA
ncbi:MAG: transcriptional regulator [Cyanobacteria bacterium SBLK]|nr:transcriptional regulator [Cyanobacteria bacterium SBLK]